MKRATSLESGHTKWRLTGGLVAVGLAAALASGPGAGAHTSNTPHCDQTTTSNCHVGGGASQNLTPAPFAVALPATAIETPGLTVATLRADQNFDGDTTDPNETIVIGLGSQTLNRLGGTLELLVFKTGGSEPQATVTSVRHDAASGACVPDPGGIGRRLTVTRTAPDAGGTLTIKDGVGNVIAPTPVNVPASSQSGPSSRTVSADVC